MKINVSLGLKKGQTNVSGLDKTGKEVLTAGFKNCISEVAVKNVAFGSLLVRQR